jgi:hypothetical protein
MDAAAKLPGHRVSIAQSHYRRSQMYYCLRLIVIRPARTLARALGHQGAPSPWPPAQAPRPPSLHRFRPPSTRTDSAITFLVPRRTSRAHRLTGFAPAVDRRRSAGRQAACCRGRTTTGLLGPSQGHQLGRGDPLVLVPPLATAAGDPPRRSRKSGEPSLPPSVSGERRRPAPLRSLCLSVLV